MLFFGKRVLFFTIFLPSLLLSEEFYIRFIGNNHISSNELYEALNLYNPLFYELHIKNPKIQDTQTEGFLQKIKEFYKTKGFYHTNISYIKNSDTIEYQIEELDPIIVDNIFINSTLDISKEIDLSKNSIFESQKFTQSKESIKLLYTQKGYCKANIDAKAYLDIQTNKANLTYNINENDPCFIRDIKIDSSTNIDTKIIKSILEFKEGDILDNNKLTRSYTNLYAYEGINSATIQTNINDDSSLDVLVVVLQNKKPIIFQTGLAFTSDEGPIGMIGLRDTNFLGNLKSLGAEVRASKMKQNIKLFLNIPLRDGDTFGAEAGYENENFIKFYQDSIYSTLSIKHKKQKQTVKESVVFERSKSYHLDADVLKDIIDRDVFLTSLMLEYNYDTRDDLFDAKDGYIFNAILSGSLKSYLSDATYYKLRVDSGVLLPIHDYTLALKSTFGSMSVSHGHTPSSYNFFAGGMLSNRAYGYKKLAFSNNSDLRVGAKSIIELTAELRFDIYKNLKGVIFNDNTYLSDNSFMEKNSVYHTIGGGARYKTPFGLIAIDAGFDISKPKEQYALHFHIGQTF